MIDRKLTENPTPHNVARGFDEQTEGGEKVVVSCGFEDNLVVANDFNGFAEVHSTLSFLIP